MSVTRSSALRTLFFACNKAIELEPNTAYIRDERAIARALTGDIQGAIKDLIFYVKYIPHEKAKTERQGWLNTLKKSENPFTEEVLKRLR